MTTVYCDCDDYQEINREDFDWLIGKMREAHILYEKGEQE